MKVLWCKRPSGLKSSGVSGSWRKSRVLVKEASGVNGVWSKVLRCKRCLSGVKASRSRGFWFKQFLVKSSLLQQLSGVQVFDARKVYQLQHS